VDFINFIRRAAAYDTPLLWINREKLAPQICGAFSCGSSAFDFDRLRCVIRFVKTFTAEAEHAIGTRAKILPGNGCAKLHQLRRGKALL
jgi:hypothetical protein